MSRKHKRQNAVIVTQETVIVEVKTPAADPREDCTACAAVRQKKGLANNVTEIAIQDDGSRVLHCNVCNTDRVVRRYDSSLRQQENIAGPCNNCREHHPELPQRTVVYSKHGSVRFCKCLRCNATWKRNAT